MAVAGAAVVDVDVAVPKRLGVEVAEDAAGVELVVPNNDFGAAAPEAAGADVVAVLVAGVVPKSDLVSVAGAVVVAGVVLEVVVAVAEAPPNRGVDDAVLKSPPPVVAVVVLLAGAAVEAGVEDWPKRPPDVPDVVDPSPPNSEPAGLVASVGGAPAGVVEPRPENNGLAGVEVAAEVPEPNKLPPVFPNRPPVVDVVAPAAGAAVVVVEAEGPVAGVVDVAAGLLPNNPPAAGVEVPEAGVVEPKRLPLGLDIFPNNDPPLVVVVV